MVPIASMSVESCTRGCWLLRDLRSTAGRLLLGACFATCTRRFCGAGVGSEQNYWLVIVGNVAAAHPLRDAFRVGQGVLRDGELAKAGHRGGRDVTARKKEGKEHSEPADHFTACFVT